MKIVEIMIYGYGKFENIKFSHLQNQQVFYGENEAGKSTIMSFIHSILFGFPTKQQLELRYEPKKGAKYGGLITAVFPDKGTAVIERVKGKAAVGDVSVRLENGITGGEELLKELLSFIDKNIFQAIFSFNLHGLQNVHQMKGEELGRFLFSTGAVGSDRLLSVDNELVKQLDLRFKPNGKNPLLNVKLKELRQVSKELKKAEENNDQYLDLLRKKEFLEKQIKIKRSSAASLSEQMNCLEEWKKAAPLFRQEKVIKEELLKYDAIYFPENGIEQIEHLKELKVSLERKASVLKQRIDSIHTELVTIKPEVQLIDKETEITKAVESLPLLEKLKQDHLQLQVKYKKLEADIMRLKNKLHISLSDREILTANTSVFMREQTAELQANQKRLKEKKHELDDQFQEEKNRLENLEAGVDALKSKMLPDSDRQKLKDRISRIDTKENISEKRQAVKERLALLTKSQQQMESGRKDKRQFLLFAILFIILGGWGIFSQLLAMMLIGGVGLLFSIYSFLKKNSVSTPEHLQAEIRNLQMQEEKLTDKLQESDNHIELLEQQLERDSLLREQWFQLTVKLERQQEQYDYVIDRFERWEKESIDMEAELLAASKELNISNETAIHYIFDAFQIIDDLKKHVQERMDTAEQLQTNEEVIQKYLAPLSRLSEQFFPKEQLSPQEVLLALKKKIRVELEKQIQYKEKQEQLVRLKDELNEQQLELNQIDAEINFLLSAASVQTEDQFRETGKKAVRKSELMDQLNSVALQLKMFSFTRDEAEELLNALEAETAIQEAADQKAALDEELSRLHDELAEIKYNIQLLEEGGTYAELLHRFKQLKSEFGVEAREWARFMMAKEMLQKTVYGFKQEKLPKMLKKAEEYLYFLTGGNYCRIIPKQEGNGFLIEGRDRLHFEANELSQATTEQIYVALRLALAVTFYDKYKLPIIIDDSFVNFDAVRTSRVVELLKQLKDHQILFFTCHEHLLNFFQTTDIIHLNEKIKVHRG